MIRVTCLSPTKSYSYCSSALAHLEFLILQASNNDPSTRNNHRATIQSKQQVQLRTVHQNKRKVLKERERIELAATVTRTQETRKTELRLKRKTAIEIFVKQKNYKFHLF